MYNIGVDLGGTSIKVGIVDKEGKIIYKGSRPTEAGGHYSKVINNIIELIEKVIQDVDIDLSQIKSLGLGSPGSVDPKNGLVVFSGNLNFHYVPIREEVQKHIQMPVFLDNDANCAALGESISGAAKNTQSSVTVTLGTGIGGGIILDGNIYRGFNNVAGEIGHMSIAIDGELCTCGRRGCWEAYASANALIRQTKNALRHNRTSLINEIVKGDMSKINAKTAFDAARLMDELGLHLVNSYIKYVAEGVTNLINIYQTEALVIGGGVSEQGEYILTPIREYVGKNAYVREGLPMTKIVAAKLGNDAGIIGAAMLGII